MRMETCVGRKRFLFPERTGGSSLNLAAAVLFTANRGFLLTDALICVFIVSVLAALCGAAAFSHSQTTEAIRRQITEQEEEDVRHLQKIGVCELCQESPQPSGTAGE